MTTARSVGRKRDDGLSRSLLRSRRYGPVAMKRWPPTAARSSEADAQSKPSARTGDNEQASGAYARDTMRKLTGCGMPAGGASEIRVMRDNAASIALSRAGSPVDCDRRARSTVPSLRTQILTVAE